jgi:hypothetical protein
MDKEKMSIRRLTYFDKADHAVKNKDVLVLEKLPPNSMKGK